MQNPDEMELWLSQTYTYAETCRNNNMWNWPKPSLQFYAALVCVLCSCRLWNSRQVQMHIFQKLITTFTWLHMFHNKEMLRNVNICLRTQLLTYWFEFEEVKIPALNVWTECMHHPVRDTHRRRRSIEIWILMKYESMHVIWINQSVNCVTICIICG